MIARLLAISIFGLCSASAFATDFSDVEAVIQDTLSQAQVAVLLQRLDDTTAIYSRQSDALFYPASVTKLFTSLATWETFGPEWAFVTQLEATEIDEDKGRARDVILRFSGDPSFTHQQLDSLIQRLSQRGIHTIEHNFIIDTSSMEGPTVPNFMVEDLPWYYAAPGGAIVMNKNRWGAYIEGNSMGEAAQLIPATYDHLIPPYESTVELAPTSITDTICPLEAQIDENNALTLKGCWPYEKNGALLRFAYTNPFAYIKSYIEQRLDAVAIDLKGNIVEAAVPAIETELVAALRGRPLAQLLADVIQQSDNLVSDNLFRALGGHHYDAAGSLARGKMAMAEYLHNSAIGEADVTLYDGSGSSRYNLFTPRLIQKVVHQIAEHPALLEILPTVGYSGNLSTRSLPRGWKMQAKTGSATGVSALAGILVDEQTLQRYSLVMIINQSAYSLTDLKPIEDKILHAIIAALA